MLSATIVQNTNIGDELSKGALKRWHRCLFGLFLEIEGHHSTGLSSITNSGDSQSSHPSFSSSGIIIFRSNDSTYVRNRRTSGLMIQPKSEIKGHHSNVFWAVPIKSDLQAHFRN